MSPSRADFGSPAEHLSASDWPFSRQAAHTGARVLNSDFNPCHGSQSTSLRCMARIYMYIVQYIKLTAFCFIKLMYTYVSLLPPANTFRLHNNYYIMHVYMSVSTT